MNILVIGSGAREHAITWKLSKSPLCKKLYIAPGNAGTAKLGENLPVKATDLVALAAEAQRLSIDFTFVGPEAPLADGIVDVFRAQGLCIFGPTKAAARIEASKAFAKELMQKYRIPCAHSQTFASFEEAKRYVEKQPVPMVLKADGLAAGKGVTVAKTRPEALKALEDLMERKVFGSAGERVVVEEYLEGLEASAFAFSDGEAILMTIPACDYKRAYDKDQGPNTGGMGAYSPPEFFHPELVERVYQEVLEPAVAAMAKEGAPYQGVLYVGLMVTKQGPKVIEFNARLGDPEAQVILPRMKTDLLEIALAAAEGKLRGYPVEWSNASCMGVVMASGGYPGDYQTGYSITGLDQVDKDVLLFHAGTRRANGRIVTDGGRVLTVVAMGSTLAQAQKKVYANVAKITFQHAHYRRDIAQRAVRAEV